VVHLLGDKYIAALSNNNQHFFYQNPASFVKLHFRYEVSIENELCREATDILQLHMVLTKRAMGSFQFLLLCTHPTNNWIYNINYYSSIMKDFFRHVRAARASQLV
jgi:hypothetical protein